MKNFFLIVPVVAVILTGCGGVHDAVNATKSMPGKMDTLTGNTNATNAYLESMIKQMLTTNERIAQTNEGVIRTNDGIIKTNVKLGAVLDATHQFALLTAYNTLLSSNSTKYLPLPTEMMIPAESMGEMASPLELAKLGYVKLYQIQEWKVDDFQTKLFDYQEAKKSDDKESKEKAASLKAELVKLAKEVNEDKTSNLWALQIVFGLAPQRTIEEMVDVQIKHAHRYYDSTLAMLALRAFFIQNVLLENDLFKEGHLNNQGKLMEAIERVSHLDYLVTLPEVNKIQFQSKQGFLPENPDEPNDTRNADIGVDADLTRGMWHDKILPALEHLEGLRLPAEQKDLLPGLRTRVNKAIDFWNHRPKAEASKS